jgi:hypothetical protein
MTSEAMKCTSCEKPKHELKQKKSKVLPGIPMYLCQDCLDNKREPRGFIILAGREFGLEHIAYWVKPQRHLGDPITIRELT